MVSSRRILLINQYFWPDRAATAQLLTDLAEDLAAAGWEVTALAGRGHYVRGREGGLPAEERLGAVRIRRTWATDFGRLSRWGRLGRLADYASFFLSAAWVVLIGPRQDVALCLSTPPFVALLGLVARLRGARFVYKVEDLYPDLAVALGALSGGSLFTRALSKLSGVLLRSSDATVALDHAMAEVLKRRGARNVTVIPNWADGQAIHPAAEAGVRFRAEHGLAGRFVVLYSGNLGLAHRFDAVADAARELASVEPRVCWLIVGHGPRLAGLKRMVGNLEQVVFLGYQPREALNALYNAADLHLVTLEDAVAGLLVPSKYAAALAAGKPVLVVGGEGTDLHREIRELALGWCCPHSPAAVTTAVRAAAFDPQATAERGRAGRRHFDQRYSRALTSRAWGDLLARLTPIQPGSGGTPHA
jgi:colanic acid biosynthesis glycosyl transferase WcaI